MIPFTFPSSPSLVTGNAECKVWYLSSVTGLKPWTDYIPVKSYTSSSPVEGTTDAAGYQAIKPISSTTGLAAWTDYIPVYEVTGGTAWSTDNNGYIPVGAAGSRLSLNFAGASALDSRITFSRGSGGGAFGSDGLYRWYGYNLLLQSQTFNTTWTQTRSGVSVDAIAAPDGTLTADKITEDSSTNTHYIRQDVIKAASSITYTLTVYAKAAERGFIQVIAANLGLTAYSQCTFNLTDGATGNTSLVGFTSATNSTSNAGNGWWRCTMTFTTDTDTTIRTDIRTATTITTSNYAGTVGSGVYVWGAQLELGSTASSYSPTTTAASGAPRFDYDPVTLAPRGLLVEEQRTNNETNGVAFSKNSGTDTDVAALGPDGVSTSARLLTADGVSTTHGQWQASVTPTSGNTYTISVFLKAGTQSIVQLYCGLVHSGATVYCNFNLSTQAMTAGAGIVSGSNFCTPVGNGWYRCGFSYVASATSLGAAVVTAPVTSISATRAEVNTLTTNYTRFGGQYESTSAMGSAPFVTSYIPTTTASATRSADSASMTGTNFSSWWNAGAGTFVVEGDLLQTPVVSSRYLNVAGTAVFDMNIAAIRVFQLKVNTTFPGTAYSATVGSVFKMAGAYEPTGNTLCGNGGSTTGDSSIPSGNTALWIGSAAGSSNFANSHIRRIQYYPTRLPNTTLQALTTA